MQRECSTCKYEEVEGFECPCNQCSFAYSEEWDPKEEEDNQDE